MKKVNITLDKGFPIFEIVPAIVCDVTNIKMTTGDIYKCICRRAKVDEVLSNGKTVRLDFTNFDKDNEPVKKPNEGEVLNPEQQKPEVNLQPQAPKTKPVSPATKPEQSNTITNETAKPAETVTNKDASNTTKDAGK